ncbi:ABC transporter ATP-binding protein [Helicovermis profundi]|uniref:ABC-type quaternary amine transporter n=1 Tax=Helicovermis profundi TaxID=3065157 RepID=A0AAU9EJP1_9FIRM|nr:ABC transporter ATP-binding protein [Clostridia bacterium S502]
MNIEIKNISKKFGETKVVEDISFKVEKGDLLSILGESGAGKTTILRIIAGTIKADSGSIIIDGKDVTNISPDKRNIGYVFQTPLLFPHMNVEANICFSLEIRKWTKEKMKERTKELLELLHIEGLEKRMPSEISGGQKQRVAIARALAFNPRVLLMDEPFSSLDPRLREEMGALIKKIQEKLKITIIFVTHDRDESMALSKEILLISKGKKLQKDSPKNIYYSPKTKEVAKYMGDCNFISGILSDNLFKTEIGEFKVPKNTNSNFVLLIRPHQIKIDETRSGYLIESCKVIGKKALYMVNSKKTQKTFLVEEFSNNILQTGVEVGLIFPKHSIHYI